MNIIDYTALQNWEKAETLGCDGKIPSTDLDSALKL